MRPFDFSAQRINRTQLPMLQTIARSFAPRAAGTLSGLIGRDAAVEFTSIESMRVADLQASLPTPGIVAAVRLKPLAGLAFIGVQPSLLVALLDAFFGGSGRPAADAQAAVSAAAQRFLTLLLKSFAPDFTAAWTVVSPLELELAKLETNPRLVQLGSAQDSVIVVRFTCELGARSGTIDWMLPDAQLTPIREALASDGGKAPARKQEPWGPALSAALQRSRGRDPRGARPGPDQLARAREPGSGRHHSHRDAAGRDAAGGRRAAAARPLRRLAGAKCIEDHSRRFRMSVPDPKAAPVARAQFNDLGPKGAAPAGQEMNLNVILDVAVTLSLEVGRARMSVRDLLQLAPGAIVELDRAATEPLDVLVNGVRIARGEVVVVNDKFGIRLTDVVSATERMEQAR